MANVDTGGAKFQVVLQGAEDSLWTSFKQARLYEQRGDIGDSREDALALFLRERLPSRFTIASGEVVDTNGNQSGQTDILIYDSGATSPLLAHGKTNVLLPAEALLATVEVKSKLTKAEAMKSVGGIKKLHSLRPWDAPYGVVNGANGSRTDQKLPRILTTVFAYQSDLGQKEWTVNEMARIQSACLDLGLPVPCLDRVVVLDRGLMNPAYGKTIMPGEKRVLGHWFFNLMNFLARESVRRQPFPWNDYQNSKGDIWIDSGPSNFVVPEAKSATVGQRNKARKVRRRRSDHG